MFEWRGWRGRLLLATAALLGAPGSGWGAEAAPAPEAALQTLLASTRPEAGQPCEAQTDRLARVLCTGSLRVGVRGDYKPYAWRLDGQPQGLEIDLARRLATALGLQVQFHPVTPANRMAALGEDRVDAIVATTGHTVQRDAQALFVRPHYHQSQTLVLGRRELPVRLGADLARRTVCVTVGNHTNAELATQGARLLLFADGRQLLEQLREGGCSLAAQDDSFFAEPLQDPAFAARFEPKFGFAPLPWGLAVPREDGAALASALGWALQSLHARGELVQLAVQHGVPPAFQQAQQARWSQPPCDTAAALQDPRCLTPPRNAALQPTPYAEAVTAFEQALQARWGVQITLAMLKTEIAQRLFLQGLGFSLALVVGGALATVGLGLLGAAALGHARRRVRWPVRALQLALQSTPMALLMLFAGLMASSLGARSPLSALALAVLVLGLFNGSHAAQALAEARASLRAEGSAATLAAAAWRARAQLAAFVVNATRGSPAASLIGVPELLAAQTDIAAFSSERVTTFTLLLLFYMALVTAVVALTNRLQQRWATSPAAEHGS